MWKLDYSSFTDNIKRLEALHADMNKVAEKVLDAGAEPARAAFARNIPRSNTEGKEHAQDNVRVFKTKNVRKSTRYRIIRVGKSLKDRTFSYLYLVDVKKPFLTKAKNDAHEASDWLMGMELDRQTSNYMKKNK